MPDFGLTEALSQALKASRGVEVMRPAEVKLAAQAAKVAPEAAAPAVPGAAPRAPSVQTPSAEAPPGAVQAPPINPSAPPADIAAPPPTDPAAATPAAPADAAQAVEAAPVDPAQAAPDAPVAPVPAKVDPGAIASVDRQPVIPATPEVPALTDVQVAAARFVDANMSDFKGKLNQTHMPNPNTMSSPDGVKAAILQIADDNKDVIGAARGEAATNEQLAGLAQDLSVDQDALRQTFDREFGPVANTASGDQRRAIVTAARMVEQNTAGSILALSSKIRAGTATSEEIAQWTQQGQSLLNWRASIAGASAEQGRNLQALSIPVGLPGDVMDHIASVLKQDNPDMQATAAAIEMAGTPGGIANIVGGMADMGIMRRAGKAAFGFVQRMYINGILWGPQTWAKIIVGNNLNLALNSFDIFAAGVGRGMVGLAARLGGFPTAAEGATISDAYAHMHGVISGGADAFRVAGRVMRSGQSLDGVMGSRAAEGANQHGTVYAALPELQGTYFGSVVNGMDQVFSASGSRIINPIDEFTKTLGYRGYLQMMQLKELRARLTAGEIKPGEAESVMTDLMKNPSPEMQQAAEAWAHRMTFQTPLPEGGAGEAFQNVLNKAPALRFIFPFMRTAINIFKQSDIERTPLALFSARLRNQIAAGGFEGDLAKSRIATGTAMLGMFAWMAVHDRITGPAPKDARERALWEMDGRTPNSFRVTDPVTGHDTWRDYSWLEPISTIASTTADIVKLQSYIHGYGEVDTMMPHESMLNDAIAHVAASVITNTSNKTFMMGAAQFSEAYNDPNRAFSMWADQMMAASVPMSGLGKFVRNEQDPYLRQAFTLIDKIKDELPTAAGIKGSKTLPPRLDVFGEPRVHKGGNAILGPLNPLPGSDVHQDAVSKEIQSVMEQTRTVPITMPSHQLSILGSQKGLQDGSGMRLTPAEYNDYVIKSRSDPIFDGGKLNFREKLEKTIATPVYQNASPAARAELLGVIMRQADAIGRQRLFQDNHDFAERMTAWTAEASGKKYNR